MRHPYVTKTQTVLAIVAITLMGIVCGLGLYFIGVLIYDIL